MPYQHRCNDTVADGDVPLLQYGFTDEPSPAFPQPPAHSLLGQFLPCPLCPVGVQSDEDHGWAVAHETFQSLPVRGPVTCCAPFVSAGVMRSNC